MKKLFALMFFTLFIIITSDAQIIFGPRMVPRPYPRRYERNYQLPNFKPTVNFSFGYGFPNLDRYNLFGFPNQYQGSVSQTGPVFGAVDYQFNRAMSIGAMVSYGKVSAPYYNYGNNALAFNGKSETWAIMLNFVRYFPAGEKVSPYLRTAIGVNIGQQNYTDTSGNKVLSSDNSSTLAYQTSLGVKFKLSKQTGLFIEAGYGKYILSGGLTLKL